MPSHSASPNFVIRTMSNVQSFYFREIELVDLKQQHTRSANPSKDAHCDSRPHTGSDPIVRFWPAYRQVLIDILDTRRLPWAGISVARKCTNDTISAKDHFTISVVCENVELIPWAATIRDILAFLHPHKIRKLPKLVLPNSVELSSEKDRNTLPMTNHEIPLHRPRIPKGPNTPAPKQTVAAAVTARSKRTRLVRKNRAPTSRPQWLISDGSRPRMFQDFELDERS